MPPVLDLGGSWLALVIGTATYTDPGFRQLRAPAQDVADMAEVLADPSIGGFTVTEVLDRAEYQLRREVDAFLTGRRVDDLVVVYLSCHGVLDARGRLFFAATDTDKSRLSSTGVESAWLIDQLEQCRARRQVLILDCCFSGSFAHTKGDPEVDLERRLVGTGRGRAVLTASRGEEYSYEGTPLPGAPGGSVFTAALVDGLRSGAADRDGDGPDHGRGRLRLRRQPGHSTRRCATPATLDLRRRGCHCAGPQPARRVPREPRSCRARPPPPHEPSDVTRFRARRRPPSSSSPVTPLGPDRPFSTLASSARAGKNHQSQAKPDFQYRANRYRFQLRRRPVGQRRRRRDSAIVGSDQR